MVPLTCCLQQIDFGFYNFNITKFDRFESKPRDWIILNLISGELSISFDVFQKANWKTNVLLWPHQFDHQVSETILWAVNIRATIRPRWPGEGNSKRHTRWQKTVGRLLSTSRIQIMGTQRYGREWCDKSIYKTTRPQKVRPQIQIRETGIEIYMYKPLPEKRLSPRIWRYKTKIWQMKELKGENLAKGVLTAWLSPPPKMMTVRRTEILLYRYHPRRKIKQQIDHYRWQQQH